jgi:hypothetical protein
MMKKHYHIGWIAETKGRNGLLIPIIASDVSSHDHQELFDAKWRAAAHYFRSFFDRVVLANDHEEAFRAIAKEYGFKLAPEREQFILWEKEHA